MAPADGDPFAESELIFVRSRVKVNELEQENEILRQRVSNCRCSKESNFNTDFVEIEPVLGHFSDQSPSSSTLQCEETTAKSKEEAGDCSWALNHCKKRYVALKIMYFGQRFHGFSSEAHLVPTVESEIFRALKRANLVIGRKEEWKYSRCGRTDKGVSSTGQVIALFLRSNLKDVGADNKDNESLRIQNCGLEIDYVKVLNRVLPEDVRVFGWCSVSTDFHARFTCLSREYRYLFWRGSLDIEVMENAAKRFIGVHDFRNFCKMDAAHVSNFRRQITSFEISSYNKRFGEDELWAMTIRGSAFLWHQVRCMVAILFMVGQGFESEELIEVLLDTEKTPRKPQYKMAPDPPLILRYCEFEGLNFICSSDAKKALVEHLKDEFKRHILHSSIFQEALCCLCSSEGSPFESMKRKTHIPLLARPTEPSFEERRAKLASKSTKKNCSGYSPPASSAARDDLHFRS